MDGVGADRAHDVGAGLGGHRMGDPGHVGGEGRAVLAVEEQCGAPRPAQVGQRQDGQVVGDPGAVVAGRRRLRRREVGERRAVERPQVRAPVADDGEAVRRQVQDQRGAGSAQMHGHDNDVLVSGPLVRGAERGARRREPCEHHDNRWADGWVRVSPRGGSPRRFTVRSRWNDERSPHSERAGTALRRARAWSIENSLICLRIPAFRCARAWTFGADDRHREETALRCARAWGAATCQWAAVPCS